MAEEVVDLVDLEDRVIGRASRTRVRQENLLHRGVGILCWNPQGQLYVHRRTGTKDVFPGLYDMFVGGMVAAGEDYAVAAAREVAEELGVRGVELRHLFQFLCQVEDNRAWVGLFEVTWDGPIVHQEEEIAWGQWLTLEEVEASQEGWTYVPDGLLIWKEWCRRYRP